LAQFFLRHGVFIYVTYSFPFFVAAGPIIMIILYFFSYRSVANERCNPHTFHVDGEAATCYGLVVYVADLLWTSYGETGVMDFCLVYVCTCSELDNAAARRC